MNTDTQIETKNDILQIETKTISRPSLVRNNNIFLDMKEKRLSENDIRFYKSIHIKIPEIEK